MRIKHLFGCPSVAGPLVLVGVAAITLIIGPAFAAKGYSRSAVSPTATPTHRTNLPNEEDSLPQFELVEQTLDSVPPAGWKRKTDSSTWLVADPNSYGDFEWYRDDDGVVLGVSSFPLVGVPSFPVFVSVWSRALDMKNAGEAKGCLMPGLDCIESSYATGSSDNELQWLIFAIFLEETEDFVLVEVACNPEESEDVAKQVKAIIRDSRWVNIASRKPSWF